MNKNYLKIGKEFHRALLYSLRDKMKDKDFATNVYKALCNIRWKNLGTGTLYNCSWQCAGGLVAEIRNVGENYTDFCCSGGEGNVTKEIEKLLKDLGWIPIPWKDVKT